eukprot:265011-Chlamydomonas_euryale.AAC.1
MQSFHMIVHVPLVTRSLVIITAAATSTDSMQASMQACRSCRPQPVWTALPTLARAPRGWQPHHTRMIRNVSFSYRIFLEMEQYGPYCATLVAKGQGRGG